MKHQRFVSILAAAAALLTISCGDKSKSTAGGGSTGGTPDGEPLTMEFPPEHIEGTPPQPKIVPNLVLAPEIAPVFRVPQGTMLLSKDKKVTSSDTPIIGSLELITDGDKQAGEGYFVELAEGPQWVQIDLGKSAAIHGIWVWHFHMQIRRSYNDVIIQISDDPEFKPSATTTVYNNDYDNSSKLGKGSDNPYVESRFGMVADGKGTHGRYVRLYSNGTNTSNDMNHYTEVEVYGTAL